MVHFEIGCRNSAATQASYLEMFDWKIEQMGPAAMIKTGGSGGIGGHITALGHEPHYYVTVYVQVDDIRAALAKAEALGGKTLVPAVNISPGSFAWFADSESNTIGLWKPAAARSRLQSPRTRCRL